MVSGSPTDAQVYRAPFFSLRRPSRSVVSRFLAHLLVRLLIVSALPGQWQAVAALFPVSMLWPLVAREERASAPGAAGPETRVRGLEQENASCVGREASQAAGTHRGYGLGYGGRAVDRCLFAKARFYDPEVGRFISQDSYLGQVDEPPSLHRYFYANDNPGRYTDATGHVSFDEVSDAAARSLGSLWGTAKFAGKTVLGLAVMAAVVADAAQPGHIVAQMRVGQAVIDAPAEVVKAVKETPGRYQSALSKAAARAAQGDHFGAGDVFTEEFTAPTATAVIGAFEGGAAVVRVGGRVLARTAARAATRDAAADAALADSGVSQGQKAAVVKEPSTTGAGPAADPAVPPAGPPAAAAPNSGVPSPNRGVTWVNESNTAGPRAEAYQQGATGARSDVATRQPQVPALGFDNPNPRGTNAVRFDGLDPDGNVLIDRKLSITSRSKQARDLARMNEALKQNPGQAARIEMPTAAAKRAAEARLNKLGVDIPVVVAPE